MSKFIVVEVSRESYTQVYLEVPDDFEGWPKREDVVKAAKKVGDFEWETPSDTHYEALSVGPIDEEDARQYEVYKI